MSEQNFNIHVYNDVFLTVENTATIKRVKVIKQFITINKFM